ncbi:hypothetical protein C8Q76DRAFT_328134 [Earliella scabrosa]|nr:hypothetical protein C8Q76DRAFT_328134 [Earliella scabrosa]
MPAAGWHVRPHPEGTVRYCQAVRLCIDFAPISSQPAMVRHMVKGYKTGVGFALCSQSFLPNIPTTTSCATRHQVTSARTSHIIHTLSLASRTPMDAFFDIAIAVPAEDPVCSSPEVEDALADHERYWFGSSHSGCIIG